MEMLRAVVVGGGAGGRLSLDALVRSPRFEPVGIADLRSDVRTALGERYPGVATFANHDDLFSATRPDIVCVSTYAPTHEEVALAALALPGLRGILVEKPLGVDTASGGRILNAIRERGVPVVVPHGLLAKAAPTEIIARVQNGEIGRLVLVEIQCRGWDILNAGIHWLHFCRMLAPNDAPVSVHAAIDASTRTFRDGVQVETSAVTSIAHESGLRIVLFSGDETPVNVDGKSFVFRLVGESGVIEFYGWENSYKLRGDLVIPAEFSVTGHRRHLETLAAQIDGAPFDDTIARASLDALELCEAAYLSGKIGARVTLPLSGFDVETARRASGDWQPGQPYSGDGGGRDGRQFE